MDGKKFTVLAIEEKDGYKVLLIADHHADIIDKSKKLRWGMAKDDVSPQDIFRMSNGTDAERAVVAKYCIQDCNLVHHLMRKIDVLTEYMEMANLCSVPINFLVFRGQGVKLTSFVAKKCMEKGYTKLFEEKKFPKQIDYLQVDIEPAWQTLNALKALPLDEYRFSVITYETDSYKDGPDAGEEAMEILLSLGYQLVVRNVANLNNPYEDWYVDPQVVNPEIVEKFINSSRISKESTKCIFAI